MLFGPYLIAIAKEAAVDDRVSVLGLDVAPGGPTGRQLCERLLAEGVLAKDTHGHTIRLAPPLVLTPAQADEVLAVLPGVLDAAAESG